MRAVIRGPKRLVLSSSGGNNVDVLKGVMHARQPASSSLGHLHKSVTSLEPPMHVQVCLRKQRTLSLFSAFVFGLHNTNALNRLSVKHMLTLGGKGWRQGRTRRLSCRLGKSTSMNIATC